MPNKRRVMTSGGFCSSTRRAGPIVRPTALSLADLNGPGGTRSALPVGTIGSGSDSLNSVSPP